MYVLIQVTLPRDLKVELVKRSLSIQQQCVAAEFSQDALDRLVATATPWTSDDMSEEFDHTNPKLCTIAESSSYKMNMFEQVMFKDLVFVAASKGASSATAVMTMCKVIVDAIVTMGCVLDDVETQCIKLWLTISRCFIGLLSDDIDDQCTYQKHITELNEPVDTRKGNVTLKDVAQACLKTSAYYSELMREHVETIGGTSRLVGDYKTVIAKLAGQSDVITTMSDQTSALDLGYQLLPQCRSVMKARAAMYLETKLSTQLAFLHHEVP